MGKILQTLEFDKIIDMLKMQTNCALSREKIETLEPTADMSEVENLQNRLNTAVSLVMRKGSPYISDLSDITAAVKRVDIGGVLGTGDILAVGRQCKAVHSLRKYIADEDAYIAEFDMLAEQKKLEEEITHAIISEDEIADNASNELANIRRQMRNTHEKIRQMLNHYIQSPSYQKHLQDAIITERNGRYVIPVKSESRNEIGGLVHDVSATGATVFVEPHKVVEANNTLRLLEAKENDEIARILAEFSIKIGEVGEQLLINQQAITELDFLFAKARLAIKMKAWMPRINQEGIINLKNARHPLIDAKKAVPISVQLGGEIRTMIITGPNTGGKTVALKTIGLLSLMAAAGLQIPVADNSEICVFQNIFADIGDEQSIEQSLSTFSAHMRNIVDIVGRVDGASLVLFDELGAGTDPVEGAALATSILEFVKNMGAITAATTHYSELKLYALSTKGVINAGCEFDIETLMPTYRLLVGIPGKSNAFAISRRLGLSDHIIDSASKRLSQETVRFEDVLTNIEVNRKRAESEKGEASRILKEAEAIRENLDKERKKLEQDTNEKINKAKREAKDIVNNAKKEVQAIINELNEAKKGTVNANKAIGKAREQISEMAKELQVTVQRSNNTPPPKTVLAGASVKLLDIEQVGTALAPPDKNGMVQVQVGILKVTSHLNNLRIVKKEKTKAENYIVGRSSVLRTGAASEIDLRGCQLEDAVYQCEQFIDNAIISGLNTVTIIHGKGSGVLRKGIGEMLKHHRHVKTYRKGLFGEGEDGVTIVELI